MQNHQHVRRRRRRVEEVQYDYYYGNDDDTAASPSTTAPTTTPTTGSTTNNYTSSYDDTSSWLTRGEKVGATIGLITLLSIGFYALLMSIKISRRRPGKRKNNASDWKICLSGSRNNNINADNDDNDNETYTLAADDGGSVVSIKAFVKSKMKTTARSIELTKSIRARSSTVPLSSSSPSNGEVDDVRNTVEINKKNKKKKIKKNKKTARVPVVSRIQQQNNERKKKLVVIPWIQHQQQTDLTSNSTCASESQQSPTDTVVTTPMYTGFPTSSSVQTDITTDTIIIPPNDNTTIATPATYNTSQYTNTTSSSAYMTNQEEWDNNDDIYDINTRYQQLLNKNKNTRKVKDDPSSKSRPFDEESGVPVGGGDNDTSSSNSSGYDVFAGIFDRKNSKKMDGHEEQQECGDGYQELEDDSVFDGCDWLIQSMQIINSRNRMESRKRKKEMYTYCV